MTQLRRVRLIACQGSIQLIAAWAALRAASCEASPRSSSEWDNVLVLYGLYAGAGQEREFVDAIRELAEVLFPNCRVVHVDAQTVKRWRRLVVLGGVAFVVKELRRRLGVGRVEEVYAGRNWQFENRLLLNSFPENKAICYGDALGVYFSEDNPYLTISSNSQELKGAQAKFKAAVKEWWLMRERCALPLVDFVQGYYLRPTAFGEIPPGRYTTVPAKRYAMAFERLVNLLTDEMLDEVVQRSTSSRVMFLLTSNFSEAGRMTRADELSAYDEFVNSHAVDMQPCALVLKPHPRDDRGKILALKKRLSQGGMQVYVMDEPKLFYMPFEVIFAALLHRGLSSHKLTILAVSAAGLPLSWLFGVRCEIGFGREILEKYYPSSQILERADHENYLVGALKNPDPDRLG